MEFENFKKLSDLLLEDQRVIKALSDKSDKVSKVIEVYKIKGVECQQLDAQCSVLQRELDKMLANRSHSSKSNRKKIYSLEADFEIEKKKNKYLMKENRKLKQLANEVQKNNEIWCQKVEKIEKKVNNYRKQHRGVKKVIGQSKNLLKVIEGNIQTSRSTQRQLDTKNTNRNKLASLDKYIRSLENQLNRARSPTNSRQPFSLSASSKTPTHSPKPDFVKFSDVLGKRSPKPSLGSPSQILFSKDAKPCFVTYGYPDRKKVAENYSSGQRIQSEERPPRVSADDANRPNNIKLDFFVTSDVGFSPKNLDFSLQCFD